MKFELTPKPLEKISSDAIVTFVFEGEKSFVPTEQFTVLDSAVNGLLTKTLELENFKGKEKTLMKIYPEGALASRIMVIGLGKKEEFTSQTLRVVMAKFALHISQINSISLSLIEEALFDIELQMHVIAEGLLLGSYSFTTYKKKKDEKKLEIVIVSTLAHEEEQIKNGIRKAEEYCLATRLARDLVNDQPTVVTPSYLAKIAQDIAKAHKSITCKVYDKSDCEKMGMEAFLGIARASDTPPKFIYLKYSSGKKTKKNVALIGKGITFDSGGINIKPGDHMQTMKMDMSGAAAVLGVFSVIAKIQPEFDVMGIIAATPNLVSSTSIVPGDVVKAMNGKTIEILNTDAEGRVTLADAISFAIQEGSTEIIDLATLTGACIAALGEDIAGLFGNNREIVEAIKKAAFETGEPVWELPLPKDYKSQNKSSVADIANLANTRWGGAITAALFLEEFVDNVPWAHLDIAGPAFLEKEFPLGPKGGTGFGVRMLLNYISQK